MSLSCECDYEPDPGDTIWYLADDYSLLKTTKRKRCCSCNNLIDKLAICTIHRRYKVPNFDIEINIYGEDGEIPRAPHYMCEECSDICFSLQELGFCFPIDEPMREQLHEYHEYYSGVITSAANKPTEE